MVHHRLNGKETNPNPHINFVSSLHRIDSSEQESARQLLRGLAAQVRPIMKSHGFSVNSLEEYECNEVFAGRNWNAGETIELVLRRPNGTFLPAFWLMSTLCHELAHIKHMNHGPDFQVLWKQLRTEVRVLQDKGYYGDGYWSSGTRLGDSAKVTGQGIEPGELPEYLVRPRLDRFHFGRTIGNLCSAVVRRRAGVLQPRELAVRASLATRPLRRQIRQADKPSSLAKQVQE
ncbi:hypothetical protein C0989_008919 [Termitomyces sp. Mn162]|nr:hypothetical protein C0989_008919 [Termitomyces sp. Mn162]